MMHSLLFWFEAIKVLQNEDKRGFYNMDFFLTILDVYHLLSTWVACPR